MKLHEFKDLFDKYDDEFLEFRKIKNKLSKRADLHAFLLVDSLVSGSDDIVGYARYEEIFLSVSLAKLAKAITEEQVVELIRCGVRLSEDSLCMFT